MTDTPFDDAEEAEAFRVFVAQKRLKKRGPGGAPLGRPVGRPMTPESQRVQRRCVTLLPLHIEWLLAFSASNNLSAGIRKAVAIAMQAQAAKAAPAAPASPEPATFVSTEDFD